MPEDSSETLPLIMYFINEEYRSLHPTVLQKIRNKEFDSEKLLRVARVNKVSYSFSKKFLELCPDLANQEIKSNVNEEESHLTKLRNTLKFVTSLFSNEGIDFLIIKQFKDLPYKTQDVDICVRDFQRVLRILKDKGTLKINNSFTNVTFKLHLGFPHYQIKGLLDLDIYRDIPWLGFKCFDEEFLWMDPRSVNLYGTKCPIPNYNADFLSILSSSLFTGGRLNLLDFLYINSLLKKNLNFDELLQQTGKYGWDLPFTKLVSLMGILHQIIYQSDYLPKFIRFPYTIPISILLESIPGPVNHRATERPLSLPSILANIAFQCLFGYFYIGLKFHG